MIRPLLVVFFVISVASIISCNKSNSTNPETLKTSLWPLKFGNSWVYVDSTFTDSSFTGAYPDTAVVLHQTLTDQNGYIYFALSDPYGWFGTGEYISVDPSNTAVYAYDSASAATYLFFQEAQDGTLIGQGSDFTNPTCPLQENQYGFSTTTMVGGYNCYKNIEYNTDCHGVVQETIVTYMAPGAGVVRIEDYLADSTNNNNPYLQYSQTLVSANIN